MTPEEKKIRRKSVLKKYNDKTKVKRAEYYQDHKEDIKNRTKEYYKVVVKPNITEADKIKSRERAVKYRQNNPDKMKLQYLNQKANKKQWERNKLATDPLFKLKRNIRSLIGITIRRGGYIKNDKTIQILGCTFVNFKAHIEVQWLDWMSWDNYGKYNGQHSYGWDIDHIIPVSSATNEEGVIALNHYTNLQPLCSKINRDIKRDNLI